MRAGVLLKSGTALERFAEVDTVVFDKTGTLTEGRPELVDGGALSNADLERAASLAAASRHPLARALVRAAPGAMPAAGVVEEAGRGLRLDGPDGVTRLGSRAWCGIAAAPADDALELWLALPEGRAVRFAFRDRPRADAAEVVAALAAQGIAVEMLSGDRPEAAGAIAAALGIAVWRAGQSPADKCARLAELAAGGHHVMMVGDGLNDAPALAAAHVSLSPSSAADISQNAADAVFQGERLAPVLEILEVARRARRLVRQNFALSLVYNTVTVPLAIAGVVTPLLAAVAMSSSSLVVVGNALRLGLGGRTR